MREAVDEFSVGQWVLQAACVYGHFSRMLAEQVGTSGVLEVVDAAELQVANARRKLGGLPQVRLRQADLADSGSVEFGANDGVCCFFLLHEVPESERCNIVDNLLATVKPGGKIVFVDYHRQHCLHPLGPIMNLVFRWLEPYAKSLLDSEIQSRSTRASDFEWTKTTYFGGLYQKLVGVRQL
jgi:SAM-dependent methyltransferase